MSTKFQQLPRESAKAYAAFRTYLDLGAERSLSAVAKKVGKSATLMERWSRRFDWPGRIAAHEGFIAQVERDAIEGLARERAVEWMKVHEDQRIQEWKRRGKLLAMADEMIARWEKNPNKFGTLEGIARLLELATKLGRLASGMPMEAVRDEPKETGTLRIEVSLALEKIYGQPLPAEVIDVSATPAQLVEKTA
jgi:hypothetical protein